MSDLISRSALIKVLKDRATNEAIAGYMTSYDVTNSIIDEVEEQPTAYDIDKVVEELEIERKTANNTYNSLNMDVDLGRELGLEKAIEIVKLVGISDDACEWKDNGTYGCVTSCTEFRSRIAYKDTYWKYCPYCGKKIKVVE